MANSSSSIDGIEEEQEIPSFVFGCPRVHLLIAQYALISALNTVRSNTSWICYSAAMAKGLKRIDLDYDEGITVSLNRGHKP